MQETELSLKGLEVFKLTAGLGVCPRCGQRDRAFDQHRFAPFAQFRDQAGRKFAGS